MKLRTLEDINVTHKTVLLRVDLNVPMQGGVITDHTRIERLKPTIDYLLKKKARIVLMSHFDRPGGKFVPSMSLAPLASALPPLLDLDEVQFGVDCIGPAAQDAVSRIKPGDVLLLENLRFHAQEEKGDAHFARELASLGDVYVNDAFSCSHRAHASITGIARHMPAAAGRLMQREIEELSSIFSDAKKPLTAIIGGAKISSKLELLENLIGKVDTIIVGGAMANTFLLAQGHSVGTSLVEKDLKATAKRILDKAKKKNCHILLPQDVVIGNAIEAAATAMVDSDAITADQMVLDIGNKTFVEIMQCLQASQTVVWNGPVGVFEKRPFDVSTMMIAREVASLTRSKKIKSIAGGGDTVAAITVSGLTDEFSYISTAGGAFLEWLEGKTLPGVAALLQPKSVSAKAKAHG